MQVRVRKPDWGLGWSGGAVSFTVTVYTDWEKWTSLELKEPGPGNERG